MVFVVFFFFIVQDLHIIRAQYRDYNMLDLNLQPVFEAPIFQDSKIEDWCWRFLLHFEHLFVIYSFIDEYFFVP